MDIDTDRFFLKSQTPQIVPAIDAMLDITCACAVIITRALDLTLLADDNYDNLAKIARGNYRLLPYAIEFWIEHCSQYAMSGGNLHLDAPIQNHIAALFEKHTHCSDGLGTATSMQALLQSPNNPGQVDDQLELFSNTPIHALVAQVLSLRRLVRQLDGDDISGKFVSNALNANEQLSTQITQTSKHTSSTTIKPSLVDFLVYTKIPLCIF